MKAELTCPHCGKPVQAFRNPVPTVDIIYDRRRSGLASESPGGGHCSD